MNQVIITKTNWNELKELLEAYFIELAFKNDAFHNYMLFDGDAYIIKLHDKTLGFFSLGNSWDNGKMIRGFYLSKESRINSKEIFEKIVKEMQIEAVLVPSNDALLVSLAFERMNTLKTTFDMQAFNFTYGRPFKSAEYGTECFVELKKEELHDLERLTDGLWEGCIENPAFTFYAIKCKDEVLGYGAIAKMKYNEKNVDVGNFTLPEHRKKGVGRSLIINLANLAIKNGYIPIAGCWYGNTSSIATLKSSGFIPENRIFYVRFI